MMGKIIYDGDGVVFGRLSSVVAKNLLKGDFVDVINCEKIIVSGDGRGFVDKILAKRRMGGGSSMKGPKYPRVADRLVKRMIRGMLPWDRPRGREAFKRLRCFNSGVGGEEEIEVVKLNFKKPMKFVTIGEIIRGLKNE